MAFQQGKYTRKNFRVGTLSEEQKLLFEALEIYRSDKYTLRRYKKILKKTKLKTAYASAQMEPLIYSYKIKQLLL